MDQDGHRVRFEWGPSGLRRLAPRSDVVVIVDVLSFTTAADVALGRGAAVLPYRWDDGGETAYAAEHDAVVAGQGSGAAWTLAPATLVDLPAGTRLVLPSPNGSALSFGAAEAGASTVLAGCLRNASGWGDGGSAGGRARGRLRHRRGRAVERRHRATPAGARGPARRRGDPRRARCQRGPVARGACEPVVLGTEDHRAGGFPFQERRTEQSQRQRHGGRRPAPGPRRVPIPGRQDHRTGGFRRQEQGGRRRRRPPPLAPCGRSHAAAGSHRSWRAQPPSG